MRVHTTIGGLGKCLGEVGFHSQVIAQALALVAGTVVGIASASAKNPPGAPNGGVLAGNGQAGAATAPPTVDESRNAAFPPVADGFYRFPAFSEPVDVKLLVDMVAQQLDIRVVTGDKALQDKKIQLLTPVDVPKGRLLDFLALLLEQNGQYLTKDSDLVYVIRPITDLPGGVGTELATTQVLPTKGLRPSGLAPAISLALKSGGGGAGAAIPGQPFVPSGGAGSFSAMDDLGVIVITDTPRRIGTVRDLIERLSQEQIQMQFTQFPVKHVSVITAKARVLELLGRVQRSVVQQFDPNNPQGVPGAVAQAQGTSSSNLSERLVPEPQTNSLLLRGRPEEVDLVRRMLAIIDKPSELVPKWYPVGPAASIIAERGKANGLGDVISSRNNRGGFEGQAFQQGFDPSQQFQQNQRGGQDSTGPTFVLDPEQRGFIYYGTPEQHERVAQLTKDLTDVTQNERVVYEFYKLRFADAEKSAQLIRDLINNSVSSADTALLPGQGGGGAGQRNSRGAQLQAMAEMAAFTGNTSGLDQIIATEDVHVLADKGNNQILVKAPARLQEQFKRLIERIDLRRAQVYIDAKIVVVGDSETFRLAVETQLINAGGTGGALRTLFGGSPTVIPATNNGILTRPTVIPGTGITSAIIKSDMVPLVVSALATTTDSRIIASPQILVDDNEEAEISSINQEPTTTTSQSGSAGSTISSFGGYEDAGPVLKVKPRISSGDLLSLEYEIELSNFGARPQGGSLDIPPPKSVNKVSSKSATIPSDSTIIVGGLTLEDARNSVAKIPFIGDIPIIGEAFRSTNNEKQSRNVYIFITPRIMRDPLGNDLRYFSKAPLKASGVKSDLPPVVPELMEALPVGGSPSSEGQVPVRTPEVKPQGAGTKSESGRAEGSEASTSSVRGRARRPVE